MKIKALIICFSLITIGSGSRAQIAKLGSLTQEEVYNRVNTLLASNYPDKTDSIKWEASHLVKSKNERYVEFGKSIYSFIGDDEAVELANATLLKKFPKGGYAAKMNLQQRLDNYSDSIRFQRDVEKWQKQYRTALFSDELNDGLYAKVANKLLDHAALNAAMRYLDRTKSEHTKVTFLLRVADFYDKNGANVDALATVKKIASFYPTFLTESPQVAKSMYTLEAELYAKQNKWEEVSKTIAQHELGLDELNLEALTKIGKYFDAFLLLDRVNKRSNLNEKLEAAGLNIFQKLGSTPAEWENYKARIIAQKVKDREQHWRSELISEEALDFELVDTEGKTVKLSDYKDKILILDFWATWCNPCIRSFPGMQASVDKYKDDPHVAFLFINTWERKPDYKENVKQFIADKGYRFHVIFDNMKDEEALVSRYKITGIPTKIIIDQNGAVRFKSTGSSIDMQEIVDEISYKVEMLKKEKSKG